MLVVLPYLCLGKILRRIRLSIGNADLEANRYKDKSVLSIYFIIKGGCGEDKRYKIELRDTNWNSKYYSELRRSIEQSAYQESKLGQVLLSRLDFY